MVSTSVLAGAFPDRAVEGLVRDLDAALSREEVRASYLAVAERAVVADGIGFYRLAPIGARRDTCSATRFSAPGCRRR